MEERSAASAPGRLPRRGRAGYLDGLAPRPAQPPGEAAVIELWIPITIFAAFMQNLRSALQKHIKGRLSTGGATYVQQMMGRSR